MHTLGKSLKLISSRGARLFIAVLVAAIVIPQISNLKLASADDGGYAWIGANCVDGTDCSGTYNWGYSLPCPSNDTNCLSYPYPNGTNPTAGMGDTWGYGVRNCTSYVAWKVNQVFGSNIRGWGHAYQWNSNAPASEVHNASGYTPQLGDIAQWGSEVGGGDGHVAYVYAVSGSTASLAEYNSGLPRDINHNLQWGLFDNSRTTASNSAGTPDHYIHIGTVSGGNPSVPRVAALQYNSEMDVFKRGSDNAIWKDTIQSGSSSWGGWNSLGGGLASNPSSDQYGAEMDVFATNSSGQLWQRSYQPSSGWGGWTLRANNMAGDPKSIAYNGNLYVFSRGTDGNLYVTYWNGSTWVGPNVLAGNGTTAMGSSPTVTIFGSEMDVYIRGTDSNLWKSGTTNGTVFGSLGSMGGGNLENDPVAITYNGEMDVYANSTSGTLIKDTWTTGWSGWNPLNGASFTGSPTALQYGSGEMDVYDRGISDSSIYQDTWITGWSGWTSRGGNEQGDPTAIQFGTEMDVYATNYANNTDKDTWLPGPPGSWGNGFSSLL